MHNRLHNKVPGYITLVSVLVVGAVGVAIVTSLLLLGVAASRTSFSYQQSAEAKGLANACAEEGLEQIWEAMAFTGTGNLSLGQGTCTYTVVNTGGQTRTVTASSTVGTVIRKVSVVVSGITPNLTLTSWQEVP